MLRAGLIAIAVVLAAGASAGAGDTPPFTRTIGFEDPGAREGALAQNGDGIRDAFDWAYRSARFTRERAFSGRGAARIDVLAGDDPAWQAEWGGAIDPWTPARPRVRPGGTIWSRFRIWWPADWSWSADPWLKLWRTRTYCGAEPCGGERSMFVDLYVAEPGGPWNPGPDHSSWWWISAESAGSVPCGRFRRDDPVRERWETFEIAITADTRSVDEGGRGRVRVWLNGAPLCDVTSLRTLQLDADPSLGHSYLGSYWNNPPRYPLRRQHAFADDITITTVTPARRDAAGNPFLGVEACANHRDDDGDGRSDLDDPGCASRSDDDERDSP